VTIGCHSLTHRPLAQLPLHELRHEVADAKRKLEDVLGTPVHAFAYPFGVVDRRVHSVVAESGYRVAVTTSPGMNVWQDPLMLRRLHMRRFESKAEIAWKLRRGMDVQSALAERLPACARHALRSLHAAVCSTSCRKAQSYSE
jgi:peptidoglycan/xylan/chitin deacetylase (PgdA/CDA1 family)